MGQCSVVPYEGEKPYVFVSYCHEDDATVFPAIEFLERQGYCLWYDRGIAPGTEWPEVIANHLEGSAAVIIFISASSLASHNCRREFNFAMMENKPSVIVFLEKVSMTPVMKMQMSSLQAIKKEDFQTDDQWYGALTDAPVLQSCRGLFTAEEGATVYIPRVHSKTTEFFLLRKSTGEKIAISHTDFKVGRKAEMCDYAMEDNLAVSRVHAVFEIDKKECYVRDNHSLNKVYVNDEELEENGKILLTNADIIDIGGELFEFQVSEAE